MSGNYIGSGPAPGGMILVGDTNPIGMVNWFHAVPDGSWLRLNGQIVAKATYPDLWAWAQGFLTADQVANPGLYRDVDAGTFALPKLDGLFLRSVGQVDASHVAAALGVKQADDNLAHTHVASSGGNFYTAVGGLQLATGPGLANTQSGIANSGGTEARPINVALVPCVKAKKTTLVSTIQPPGRIIQSAAHVRGDFLLGAGTFPIDDTIPQITEGSEFFTLAFAPQQLGSRLKFRALWSGSNTGLAVGIIALFKAGQADALAVNWFAPPNSTNWNWFIVLDYEETVAALTPQTYSIRVGAQTGGGSMAMNGASGARFFGGAFKSAFRIEEISQ